MKIYQAVQELLVGDTDRQTYRGSGDLVNLLLFLESRQKIALIEITGRKFYG
jgi:hypothetical protein